ncbi:hypothetical protein FSP39_013682 [Pinctada imbricata]|uniref:Uncharacterized protein n=1 Tax=Pinctada imbricata TaxID=66713 RepID=A0AA88YMN4_PINIB|nr:hypothetical protein FSP39_013682 [Pinctada imbricata]
MDVEITTLTTQSLENCVHECIRRPRCLSINHKARVQLCILNFDDSESNLVTEIGSIFSPINRWNKYNVGSCWNRTRCDISERCTDGSSGPCEPSDCGHPPDVPGAMLTTGNPEIGLYSRIEYACLSGYTLHGISVVGFDCGSPTVISNTEVRLLNGSTTYRSQAEYSCEEGGICGAKMTLVNSDQAVVECQADGLWSSSSVECIIENVGMGECTNDSVVLDVAYILDDTNSVDDGEFQEQLGLFQTLSMRLTNVTSCARVSVFRHHNSFNIDFGFGSYNTTSDTCNSIGSLARRYGVGDEEIEVTSFALGHFPAIDTQENRQRGVILVVSDRSGTNWNSNAGRTVLEAADDKSIDVVTIKMGGNQQQASDNHHPIDVPGSQDLVTIADDCMTIITNVYTSAIQN